MFRPFDNNKYFCCFLIALFLAGCSSDEETDNRATGTFSGLWSSSFSGCGVNCHSPDAADGTENGPDMSSKDKFYANLVNKSAADYPAWLKNGNCDSVNFITPGNAAASSLPASLIESASDALAASQNCTTSFNLHVVNNVTVSDKDGLIEWINAGAAND